MARLVLHIGTHKTGTSHLQALFRRNHALLAAHGVIFPQIGRDAGQHALVSRWNPLLQPEPEFDADQAWRRLIAEYAHGPQTVFLSSEEFSRMRARRTVMPELAGYARAFEEVLVLCTLRNQAGFLQSVCQQIIPARPPADWQAFFDEAIRLRYADGLSLDYDRLYSHLITGFRREEIRLIAYDSAIRREGGMIGAVLEQLGLSLRAEDLEPVTEAEANISPPPLASLLAAELARPAPPPPGLIRLTAEALAGHFPEASRSSLFTRAELERIEAVFTPLNQALSRRIASYQPDFRIGALPSRSPDLCRDEIGSDFWIALCRQLSQVTP